MGIINQLKRYAQNIPGVRIKRKILVIESDDWGSIRMPSQDVYLRLQKEGYQPEKDPYLKYDSLASNEDLEALFEALNSVKDKDGNPAVITANTITANPDFDEIKSNNFQDYKYEPFTETLKKYPKHDKALDLWKQGIDHKLFYPQYHGREHVNVYQWMKGLRENDVLLRKAFDYKMLSISSVKSKMRFGYMEGLDFFSEEEKSQKDIIIRDGAALFNEIFGYSSLSYIANCYIWDKTAEKTLKDLDIRLLQGISNQICPQVEDGKHYHKYVRHYMGQRNEYGQRYLIRNVFFEPSLEPNKDWVTDAFQRINIAFQCGKPAIIGSHRLNYIGFVNTKNRVENLKQLKELLLKVKKKWPAVEFKSTDQLKEIF